MSDASEVPAGGDARPLPRTAVVAYAAIVAQFQKLVQSLANDVIADMGLPPGCVVDFDKSTITPPVPTE